MPKYGIYSIGDSLTQGTMNSVDDIVNGHRFRFKWSQVETAAGVFDFTYIKAQMDIAYNAGKNIWLQFNISPCNEPSDYNCPAYLFAAPYNVPKVFTSTSGATRFYPHYVNANFATRHKNFLDKVYEWIATLPTPYQEKIVLILSAEGKTGDTGPYSGIPTNPAYNISDADWNTHKYDLWDYQAARIAFHGLSSKFMVNPGNDGENLQKALDDFPTISLKNGDASHNFDYSGSRNLAQRYAAFRDPATGGDFENITGGEFENTDELFYYTGNPKGYLLPFIGFNLAAGTSIINISPNTLIADRFAYEVFNEFAEFRDVSEADKGVIFFRRKIDFNDKVTFPEATYGPVIDPARLSGPDGYTQKYNSIINSTKPDALKADNITSLGIAYYNPARLTAIQIAVPNANYIGLTTDRDYDAVSEDIGFDVLPGDFSRYVSMNADYSDVSAAWRIGFYGFHGRYVKYIRKGYFSTPLLTSGDFQVKIKVNYYDAGNGTWELFYHNGVQKVSAGSIDLTDSGIWEEAEFNITHFFGGGKLTIPSTAQKCDFTIEKVSGDDTAFSMLRFYRIAENAAPANIAPVADAGTNQTITEPTSTVTLTGSGTDADGTIIGYNWTQSEGNAAIIVSPYEATTVIEGLTAGIYKFRLKVIDDKGLQGFAYVTITVLPEEVVELQPPTAIITSSPVVINEPATFSSSQSFDNDGTIASRLWSLSGPAGTIDDNTAENINLTITAYGDYVLTLLITDSDDQTDEATYSFSVVPPVTPPSIEVMLPKLEWLHFIADKDYKTASVINGVTNFNAEPTPFKQHPEGWKDIQISFGTNEKYFSLNRSFSIPLKYVGDAAAVLRYMSYKGKGYEAELYAIIAKWNRETGIHQLEYRGKIDMSKMEDNPVEGVTVNTIEGGVLSYLTANEGKTYEIPGDETNERAVKVLFDGINLRDTHRWSTYEFDFDSEFSFIPLVYLGNDGDSVGVITGGQIPEVIDIDNFTTFLQNSSNYPFTSINPIVSGRLYGTISFESLENDGIPAPGATRTIFWVLRSNNAYNSAEWVELYRIVDEAGQTYSFDFDVTFDLAADEKLYLAVDCVSLSSGDHRIRILNPDNANNIYFQITTRPAEKTVFAIRPLDLWKQLISKATDGRYTGDSSFFKSHNNIVAFCGDALRNTSRDIVPNYLLATNIQDFFTSYNSFYNLALKAVNDVLYIEPKEDVYNDENVVIFDLGEVADLVIRFAQERLVSKVLCGYFDQDYQQRNGKYEFNTNREYKLPVLSTDKEYDIRCKYRGDAFGQTFLMDSLDSKDTTDNEGDKSVFVANADIEDAKINYSAVKTTNAPAIPLYEEVDILFNTITGDNFSTNFYKSLFTYSPIESADYTFDITITGSIFGSTSDYVEATLYINDVAIATKLIYKRAISNQYRIDIDASAQLNYNDKVRVHVVSSVGTANITYATIDMFTYGYDADAVYPLKRVTYDNLTGVLDDTVYNIEEMTPARQFRAHTNYLNGLMKHLQDGEATFQTGSKNVFLSTELDGEIIAENANIPVSEFNEPFFIPYEAEFKAISPYTFSETLAQMGAGIIKFTYRGYDLYALAIGNMTAKPATDEPQTWKLLLHAKNSLTSLLMLSSPGTFYNENNEKMIFVSDLNPVHFLKYNFERDARYHHSEMYDTWVHERHDRYLAQPAYLQKWQLTDTINLQVIASNLGQIEMYIYDNKGELYTSVPFVYSGDAAVQPPFTKQMISLSLADFDEGEYLFVIRTGETNLFISEWQSIKEDHPKTYLFEYYNTVNKLDAYFTGWRPSVRVESFMHELQPDSSFVNFEDEPGDVELLRGRPYMKRVLTLGGGTGIPDWMANKLNSILLLNRVTIEGIRYTRSADSKFEVEERIGYPLNYYRVQIQKALNETGIAVTDDGTEIINGLTSYTLDAKMFGQNAGVINITTRNE